MAGEGRDPLVRAYIEIKVRRDPRLRDELRRAGRDAGKEAGREAGQSYSEQFWRTANTRLRDGRPQAAKAGADIGASMGVAAGDSYSQQFWRASGRGLSGGRGRHVLAVAKVGDEAGRSWAQAFSSWASKGTSKVGSLVDDLGKKVGKIKPLWAFGGAAALSGIGPLAGAFGTAAVNVGQFAAEVAPLVGILPVVAAGGFLIVKALGAARAAMAKEFSPVTKGFKEATDAGARLAAVGIRPLAAEFDRVNMPFVERAMERIGKATNTSTREYLGFINSVEGTRAVKEITSETAGFFERLAPGIEDVAEAATRLGERIADVTFERLGNGADWATDKITGFFDSISDDDIDHAFDRLVNLSRDVRDGILGVVHALQWLDEHRSEISKASDVIAVGLIGIGVATGNLPLAAGAAVTLTMRHWDDLTGAWDRVQKRFEGSSAVQTTADALSGAWDQVKDGWSDFVDIVGPPLRDLLDQMGDSFIEMQPAIQGVATLLGPLLKLMLQLAGISFAVLLLDLRLLVAGMGKVAYAAAWMVGQVLEKYASMIRWSGEAAQKLHLPFADEMVALADAADLAAAKVNASLDEVKTDQAQQEIKDLQARIKALQGKKVKAAADHEEIKRSKQRIRELRDEINNLPSNKQINFIVHMTQWANSQGYGVGVIDPKKIHKKASGGLVEGPGTGTSDSIHAMLSDREYVQSNAAVEHYGVATMDAINQRRIPKAALRLASGGLASLTRDATIAMGQLSESKPARIARAAAAMQQTGPVVDVDALAAAMVAAVEQGIKRGMKRMDISMDGQRVAQVVDRHAGGLL